MLSRWQLPWRDEVPDGGGRPHCIVAQGFDRNDTYDNNVDRVKLAAHGPAAAPRAAVRPLTLFPASQYTAEIGLPPLIGAILPIGEGRVVRRSLRPRPLA